VFADANQAWFEDTASAVQRSLKIVAADIVAADDVWRLKTRFSASRGLAATALKEHHNLRNSGSIRPDLS
jgi:hypothetical protein